MYGNEPRAAQSPGLVTMSMKPTRVQAAMEFVELLNRCTSYDDRNRDTDAKEQRAYNEALAVCYRYFAGEMDYGDLACFKSGPHPEDAYAQHVEQEKLAEQEMKASMKDMLGHMFGRPPKQDPKPAEEQPKPLEPPYTYEG